MLVLFDPFKNICVCVCILYPLLVLIFSNSPLSFLLSLSQLPLTAEACCPISAVCFKGEWGAASKMAPSGRCLLAFVHVQPSPTFRVGGCGQRNRAEVTLCHLQGSAIKKF